MSPYSIGHAGTTATGQRTTPSGNATLAAQGRHRTSGEIRLGLRMKPDGTIGDAMIDGAKTGTVMIANAKSKGGNAFHLRHQGVQTATGIRMPPTSCSSASVMTSEAGASDSGR